MEPHCKVWILLTRVLTCTDSFPGITGGFGGDRRVEFIITPELVKQGFHDFVIESSCNGMFGVPWNGDTIAPPDVRCLMFSCLPSHIAYFANADEQILFTRVG